MVNNWKKKFHHPSSRLEPVNFKNRKNSKMSSKTYYLGHEFCRFWWQINTINVSSPYLPGKSVVLEFKVKGWNQGVENDCFPQQLGGWNFLVFLCHQILPNSCLILGKKLESIFIYIFFFDFWDLEIANDCFHRQLGSWHFFNFLLLKSRNSCLRF